MMPMQQAPNDMPSAIDKSQSILNPRDAFMMKEQGKIRKDMTVRELFGGLGVDVDGPVTQLAEMVMREKQKADPLGKMRALAGADQMPEQDISTGDPAMGGMPTEQGGSLDDLLRNGGRRV
jgi:hypothetical protein